MVRTILVYGLILAAGANGNSLRGVFLDPAGNFMALVEMGEDGGAKIP